MTEDDFWELIEAIDEESLFDGDDEAAVEPLIEALMELKPKRIQAFQEHLARALYRLDGQAYAAEAGDSGESSDGFLYVRCFVVACGRAVFEEVVGDPSKMAEYADEWCEALLSAADEAWFEKTGEEWDFETTVSYETGSNEDQW